MHPVNAILMLCDNNGLVERPLRAIASVLLINMKMCERVSRVVEHSVWIEHRIRGASLKLVRMSRQLVRTWAQAVTNPPIALEMLRGSMTMVFSNGNHVLSWNRKPG